MISLGGALGEGDDGIASEGDTEAEVLTLDEIEPDGLLIPADGDRLELGETDALRLLLGESDPEALADGETDKLIDADGLSEPDSLLLGLRLTEIEALGLTLALTLPDGDTEVLGLTLELVLLDGDTEPLLLLDGDTD